MNVCACGCAQPVKGRYQRPGVGGWRVQRYVSPGHSLRVNYRAGGWAGRRHTAEARENIAAARRNFYADHPEAKLVGQRNPMFGRNGPSNPNYVSGSTPERQRVYASAEGRAWRRAVVRRDGAKCRLCTGAERLHAHHIEHWSKAPELRLVVANGVTLCDACHRAVHSGRKEVPSVG